MLARCGRPALLHEVRGFACGLETNHEGHANREKELVEYFLSHAMAGPPSKPFSKMQQLAQLQRFGTRPADVPASCIAVGSLLHVLYLLADSGFPSGRDISAVLQCSVAENGLANDLFKRVPELDEDSKRWSNSCVAASLMLKKFFSARIGALWTLERPSRCFLVATARIRREWHRSRVHALHEEGVKASTTSGRRASLRNVGPHVGELHE